MKKYCPLHHAADEYLEKVLPAAGENFEKLLLENLSLKLFFLNIFLNISDLTFRQLRPNPASIWPEPEPNVQNVAGAGAEYSVDS